MDAWINENVKFVPKEINLPNVPQARPIENFWVCLAQKVYEGGWETKTEQQEIRRIECKMKEFDKTFVESLLEGAKAKSNLKVITVSMLYLNNIFLLRDK